MSTFADGWVDGLEWPILGLFFSLDLVPADLLVVVAVVVLVEAVVSVPWLEML